MDKLSISNFMYSMEFKKQKVEKKENKTYGKIMYSTVQYIVSGVQYST